MKRLLLFTLAACCGTSLWAQKETKELPDFKKNIVKLNLFSLPLKNISLQYERGLNEDMSVALGVRFQPKGSIPFQGTLRNSIDDDNDTSNAGLDFINSAQISNWAITPEFRYYFGKKPLNGFYVAPFLRFGGYGIDWDYNYQKDDGTIKPVHLTGRSTAFSGGILLGAQWHFNNIVLDWWILGPQYGSYNISLDANGDFSDLTPQDKEDLERNIEGIGWNGNKFKATVTDKNVKAENKISLPGLRTGLCIGYTF
jgi:hypothetical protein